MIREIRICDVCGAPGAFRKHINGECVDYCTLISCLDKVLAHQAATDQWFLERQNLREMMYGAPAFRAIVEEHTKIKEKARSWIAESERNVERAEAVIERFVTETLGQAPQLSLAQK